MSGVTVRLPVGGCVKCASECACLFENLYTSMYGERMCVVLIMLQRIILCVI